jgi:hypothetical protein
MRPIWPNSTFAGSPYASTKTKQKSTLADGQLAQNLPMGRFKNRNESVKLFPLSVAIVVALAVFLAPLSRAIADQRCDMLGRSASQAKNCHGCCNQMKCCSVSKQEEKAQSTQSTSSSRSDSGFGNILAVTSKDFVLLYSLPDDLEKYRRFRTSSAAPLTLSLARLCIRLI